MFSASAGRAGGRGGPTQQHVPCKTQVPRGSTQQCAHQRKLAVMHATVQLMPGTSALLCRAARNKTVCRRITQPITSICCSESPDLT